MSPDDPADLHAMLFPIGPRQRIAMEAAHGTASDAAFLAVHRGIARALADTVAGTVVESGGDLARWLLLRDEGVASALLWDPSPLPALSERVRTSFHRAYADLADLGDAYGRVLPADLRHRLGEHYTPRWLAARVAARVPPGGVVADPSCGDGRFLAALAAAGHTDVWGADLNPLAVVMARVNAWTAAGRPPVRPDVDIVWGDFILAAGDAPIPPILAGAAANVRRLPRPAAYVGNPPWVTWRNLSGGYRAAIAAQLTGSRLHGTSGWSARVSGPTDLAHVFLHHAAERVAAGGLIAFVLPRTVFKAPVGPGGVRAGETTSGRPYRFTAIWECEAVDAFAAVRLNAVVAFVAADERPAFPVPWRAVSPRAESAARAAVLSDPDDPTSPWSTGPDGPLRIASGPRWADLRARGGINTGGGNAVFYVAVRGSRSGNLLVAPKSGATWELEPDFVRPLLRGRDVAAWSARPSGHVVLPHDETDLRRPVDEAELGRIAPLTLAYLRASKEMLAGRRERARWRSGSWFTLFRIGPYTAGCWRVVWPHSANGRLRAALLAPDDRTVPDQKVVLVPFDAREPALFLTALLNASVVGAAASASGGLDASPNLVRRLPLPRFDPARPAHRRIVSLAADACAGDETSRPAADEAVGELFR